MAINTTRLPEKWNMSVKRGDRWPAWGFLLVDEDGTAIDSFDVKMQLRLRASDSAYVKQLVPDSGFIKYDNSVTFDCNVDLPTGIYQYDIQVILANGHVYTQYEGIVEVKQDATR